MSLTLNLQYGLTSHRAEQVKTLETNDGRLELHAVAAGNLGRTVMRIRVATRNCRACTLKPRCMRSERRLLTPRSREEHEALVAARAREGQPAFAADRRRRAGIEGTLSCGVRALGLRRSRYHGLANTHLQHLLTAAAINLSRLAAWIDDVPAARPRRSAFARLMAQPISA